MIYRVISVIGVYTFIKSTFPVTDLKKSISP